MVLIFVKNSKEKKFETKKKRQFVKTLKICFHFFFRFDLKSIFFRLNKLDKYISLKFPN